MSDTKLVSFIVNKENWEVFKKLAFDQGRSASNCLNQLIEQALYKNDINLIDNSDITPIDLTDFVTRAEFDRELHELKCQLIDLRQKIDQSTAVKLAPELLNVPVKGNSPKIKEDGDRRTKILELMGYIPTCPQCGTESLSKEGHGKGEGSYRFRCVNSSCPRQKFTAYSSS
jgi:endogenous inhibitor of DNA gyrase (YacG/DUF329 family)